MNRRQQGPWGVTEVLRNEAVGGVLLLMAAVVALIWANSPWREAYQSLVELQVGPASLHLDLSLGDWAADGLLAVFFFVAGLELKTEFVTGSLRRFSTAVVPMAAAFAGMIVPAAIYAAINLQSGGELHGWGIPMATDIAFALAVLAVAGSWLPAPVRLFLLTLAVVDDLGAITVIAVFYSEALSFAPLIAAVILLGVYAWLQHRRVRAWWLYVPIALATWVMVDYSGVHATVAGICLGLLTRARRDEGEVASPTERLRHRIEPLSAGFCVPLFAFFAAGVTLVGADPLRMLTEPVPLGIVLGLVIGKPVGVIGGTWLVTRWRNVQLAEGLQWADIRVVGMIAGVGFTVSLLIAGLAFPDDPAIELDAKFGILVGSAISAALATVILIRRRARTDSEDAVPIPGQ